MPHAVEVVHSKLHETVRERAALDSIAELYGNDEGRWQMPTKVPLDLHRKLFNVQQIVLSDKPNDEDHFFRFAKGFKKLVTFRFEKLPEEAFLERLATESASNWYVELEFDSNAMKGQEKAEFEFIFKFDNLARLMACKVFKNAFIKRLFDRFDSFDLSFYVKAAYVQIVHKSRSSAYEYTCERSKCKSFEHLDDLLKSINEEFKREDYDPDKIDCIPELNDEDEKKDKEKEGSDEDIEADHPEDQDESEKESEENTGGDNPSSSV